MSEPFRTRQFVPVPPHERPHRSRSGARIVVTDGSHVLLMADTDPGIPGSRWWVTPGGGIDAGETPRRAAVRELAEETGLQVSPEQLLGPVAVRDVVHGYSDQVLHQHESFFVLVTPRFEVDTAGQTEGEQLTMAGHAWHPLEELAHLPEPVWPSDISRLVETASSPDRWPIDLGEVEESTIPVDEVVQAGQRLRPPESRQERRSPSLE